MPLPAFDNLAASAATIIFDAIGTSATYTTPGGTPFPASVIKNPEIGEFTDFDDGTEQHTYIALLCDSVEPEPGGKVTIGLSTFDLTRKVFGDGVETRWAVRDYAG